MSRSSISRLSLTRLTVAATALTLAACAGDVSDDSKAEAEEGAPVDGAFDSFSSPIDHGTLAFSVGQSATLAANARYHGWQFTVGAGGADVTLRTFKPEGRRTAVDTVLYLYRMGRSGWGRYLYRNDDVGDGMRSSWINAENLGPGTYRALVKGHTTRTVGPFGISVSCDGAGCSTGPQCPFGRSFGDFSEWPLVAKVSESTLSSPNGVSALGSRQIIVAVGNAGIEARTLADAFESVDGGELTFYELRERAGTHREFTLVSFYAGDTELGTIFEKGSTTVVAVINDSDVEHCTVTAGDSTACAPVTCELYCENGFARGSDGCETCTCSTAAPRCAPVTCELLCPNGFARGNDGCATCRCR